jgi:hypothetical protein
LLKRWQQISTIIIEIVKGEPRIEKLRVINLFKADYNFFLKVIWGIRSVRNAHLKNRFEQEADQTEEQSTWW